MKAEGKHFGMDVSRLAVGGDSAGGNISAALAQRHKDLMLQLLVYPATELAATYPSFEENMDGRYLLDESALTTLAPHVSKGCEGLDLTDNWLNPARLEDCSGLPPAMIVTCGFDPIRDHGLDYSSRLRIAGVPVQLVHYAGQFHGFINFDTINSAARNFLEQASDAMRRAAIGEYFDSTVEVRDGDSYQSFTGGLISSSLMTWESVTRWRRKLTPKKLKSVSKVWDTCTDHLRAGLSKRLDKLEVTETYCGAA
ncbi:Carboxylesterase NlhH [compost metagenome]